MLHMPWRWGDLVSIVSLSPIDINGDGNGIYGHFCPHSQFWDQWICCNPLILNPSYLKPILSEAHAQPYHDLPKYKFCITFPFFFSLFIINTGLIFDKLIR